jgi:thermitase
VAGIIAANANNNIGIVGVASKVSILPVKVLDKDGFGLVDDVIAGLLWAVDNGARVINVSFYRNRSSPDLEEAVEYARQRGVIVVAAAGNSSTEEPTYPAALDTVIAVAATDARDGKLTGSNHGDWIDVGAPGLGIVSTSWSGGSTYETVSGTSFAAPHVSGTVALMLSVHAEISVQEAEAILKATADGAMDTGLGAGRLNAARAVMAARDLAQRRNVPPLQVPTNQAPPQISPR